MLPFKGFTHPALCLQICSSPRPRLAEVMRAVTVLLTIVDTGIKIVPIIRMQTKYSINIDD